MSTATQPPVKRTTQSTILPILVGLGYLKSEIVDQLPQMSDNAAIEDFLVGQKLVNPDAIVEAYAQFYDLPFVRLKSLAIKPAVVQRIPELIARGYDLTAYDLEDDILSVALATPRRIQPHAKSGLLHRLQKELGVKIAPAFAPVEDIRAVHRLYQQTTDRLSKGPKTKADLQTNNQTVTPPAIQPVSQSAASQQVHGTINLVGRSIAESVLHKFPREVIAKYQLVPFEEPSPGYLKLAAVTPEDKTLRQLVNFLKEKNKLLIDLYQTDPASLVAALAQYDDSDTPPSEGQDRKEQQLQRLTAEMAAQKIMQISPAPASDQTPQVPQTNVAQSAGVATTTPSQPNPTVAPAMPSGVPPTLVPPISPPAPATTTTTAPASTPAIPAATALPVTPSQKIASTEVAQPNQTNIPEIKEAEIAQQPAQSLALNPGAANSVPANQAVGEPGNGEKTLDLLVGQPIASVNDLMSVIRSGSVPKIVAAMLILAVDMRSSDVHLESEKERLRLRYRIDGELVDILFLPKTLQAPIVSRIKILSQLKIDENRIPQDGRFDVSYRQREIDLRVSTLPAIHGEKVVMRILDKSTGVMSLKDMGVDGPGMKRLQDAINKPYGIVLSTGPTGSGKSTTLYAILQQISQPNVNVVTLEDPVEYEIAGINQTQIKPKIGFTFAEGLRSILRQDPDIIMVGEIRDKETAEMATHAALTGHLVLSTLHTNTASGALPRLINMGIEPFLITSSLNVAVGQRLVRRVCSDCQYEDKLPPEVIEELKQDLASPNIDPSLQDPTNWHFVKGRGCDKCNNGYRGRIGIFEVLVMSETIENLGVKKEPASAIEAQAIKEGMVTMKQDGLLKAIKGLTTLEEILKATTE